MKLTYKCILYSSHSLKIYFISRLFFSKCILIFSKDASKSYTVLFSWRCVYFTIVWCTLYNKVIQFMFRLKHTFSLLSAFKQARTWEAVNIVWTKDAACFLLQVILTVYAVGLGLLTAKVIIMAYYYYYHHRHKRQKQQQHHHNFFTSATILMYIFSLFCAGGICII